MASRAGTASRTSARTRVLDAAMEVIAEVGPERVRVQDIAERAGMSAGHVMYYFGNRDRILVDTLLLGEADLATTRDRRVAAADGPAAALTRIVRLYLPQGPHDVRWTLWSQLFARPPQDAETLRGFAEVVDSWAAAITVVIRDGVAGGVLRCDDPPTVAYRACRLMDGYSLEVVMATPGRTRPWAVGEVLGWLGETLHVGL